MRIILFSLVLFLAGIFLAQDKNYLSVNIGGANWMKENLNVSNFANGDTIFQAKTAEDWLSANLEKKPAWCYYDFSEDNEKKYGKLYNWYAVSDSRGLAPKGWRIPKETDFASFDKLYGYKTGLKLKLNIGWDTWESVDANGVKKSNQANGDNSTGFSGIPAGCIDLKGNFFHQGIKSFYWTLTEKDSNLAINRGLRNDEVFVFNFSNKGFGYSIRCVK